MLRKIIKIDEEKCNGCEACVIACHEGAIGMVNGKAKLLRDDYCDGLGDCLPSCPTGAITFETREALAFDAEAVAANQGKPPIQACPGSLARSMERKESSQPTSNQSDCCTSELNQWPIQIKLVPTTAPYFDGAKLLIAADCTAFAYAKFHQDFIKSHVTIIGCPKLDMVDYQEKLAEIIRLNDIKSIKVVRMEVPCCGGIEHAAVEALKNSGKFIPWQVITVAIDGTIVG